MSIRLSRMVLTAFAVSLAAAAALGPAPVARASGYATISGSGSSWSSVALAQWAENLRADGIVINFNPDGSAAGRADYMAQQVDFAASDPPFRNGTDKLGGAGAEYPSVGYSYVPDTAGGTAFMYHLTVAGHLVTNLRLSGLTLMKIFTGQITNWDDPQITKDYGAQLPDERIIPVIRSDGSGATFFFTRWMATMFPAQWNAFCSQVTHGRVQPPCGQTEFYPQFPGAVAQDGSNNVATYISASYGEGAIGYDEYAYALNSHFPVVKLLNPAGYYVLPTASNVAVALTRAQINEDPGSVNFLQQDLDNVYTYTDPRSYPLSSYSYLIVPRSGTAIPTDFTGAAGQTLSTFVNYFLCAGQQFAAELGYSPLPLNLIQGGLLQEARIPGHVAPANLATNCDNPTIRNGQLTILADAPEPSPCDKLGEPLDCVVVDGKATTPGAGGAMASASASAGITGTTSGSSGSGSGPAVQAGPVTGTVVNLAAGANDSSMLAVLTAAEILVVIAAPPAIYALVRRRRRAPR
ncbi:MAG: substrate-binding domain-containing protein [Streptosporangiaceae bacterium]|nr:phosphate ABC transporter substrate-binding protein [Actinomycetota bacterium]